MIGSYKLTPGETIIKSVILLNRENPFFASILLNFDITQTQDGTKVPTMGVTKYGKLYWNEEFVEQLNQEELRYVLCHEVLHIAKGDLFRRGHRNPELWNVAADLVINDILNIEGFKAPTSITLTNAAGEKETTDCELIPDRKGNVTIDDKVFNVRNKIIEELYDELQRKITPKDQTSGMSLSALGMGQGSGDGNPVPGHGGFDVHIEGGSDDKGNDNGDEASGNASVSAAEAKWRKITVQAATIAAQRGVLPGCASDLVEGLLNPVIDWRQRLRSFIINEIPVDFETRLPGRKFYGTGVWCPKVYRENVNLFVSIDCSGSTYNDRERFVSEIQGICESHTQLVAHLIFWSYGEISEKNDIIIDSQSVEKLKNLNLKDINGGTELSSYNRYLDKQGMSSRLHIVLTDGYIEQKPEVPDGTILFVLCGDCSDKIVKNYGECIFIRDVSPDWD